MVAAGAGWPAKLSIGATLNSIVMVALGVVLAVYLYEHRLLYWLLYQKFFPSSKLVLSVAGKLSNFNDDVYHPSFDTAFCMPYLYCGSFVSDSKDGSMRIKGLKVKSHRPAHKCSSRSAALPTCARAMPCTILTLLLVVPPDCSPQRP